LAAILVILDSSGTCLSQEARSDASSMQALAKKSSCFECHADKNPTGPTFHQIAEKYKTDPVARRTLSDAIRKGSKGNWTAVSKGVPMPPYSRRLTDAQISHLVDWLLQQ
jgi:cytochrome c